MSLVQFVIGKTYETSSIGDSNCKITEIIVARTDKTVTTAKGKKFRISVYNNVEQFRPWGTYSMAPILAADDEIEAREARRANRLGNAAATSYAPAAPAVAKPVPATAARLALPLPVWASMAVANCLIVACANPIPGVEIEGE
jgi:hypothetical protein